MNAFNNQQMRSQIDMYLDRALPSQDEQNLISKVSHDPQLNQMLEEEKSFRNFIKDNVKRSNVSPELIRTIKERINTI